MNEMTEAKATNSRTVSGVVIGAQMDKTIKVQIERKIPHPLYRKYVKRYTKLYAHDEGNDCKENDKVLIQECRPISKKKCWRLVEILDSSAG